jgi:hypothetical protein
MISTMDDLELAEESDRLRKVSKIAQGMADRVDREIRRRKRLANRIASR